MNKKQVFTHLCTWFKTRQYSGHWKMWNSDYIQAPHDPDYIYKNNKRDIAAINYPLTDVYDSSDPDLIEYQFLLMKLSGIDGIIVDWDGQRLNKYRHNTLMDIVPYLNKFNMKLIVCFEEWCGYWPETLFKTREEQINAAKDELNWLFDNLCNQDYYAEVNGKKPILIFRKINHLLFNPDEWQLLKDEIKDKNGAIIFGNSTTEDFNKVLDGWYYWTGPLHLYKYATSLDEYINHYQNFLRQTASTRIIFGSIIPGFDDSKVWGWGETPRALPRYHGKRFEETWKSSIKNNLDFVQIVTWNDWNEGSHIEPSDEFEYDYLILNKKYSALFKQINDNIPDSFLEIPLKIYKMRKENKYNPYIQDKLNNLSNAIINKNIKEIRTVIARNPALL